MDKTQREDTTVNGRFPHINILGYSLCKKPLVAILTVKCENNTEDGLGIYREAVLDKTSPLDDAQN